jgi:hypothetical protein
MATYGKGYSNGWHLPTAEQRAALPEAEKLANQLRGVARGHIKTLKGDYYFGPRFLDNDRVAFRAVCHWNGNKADLQDFVMAAFIDSASADHWYMFEKQWD